MDFISSTIAMCLLGGNSRKFAPGKEYSLALSLLCVLVALCIKFSTVMIHFHLIIIFQIQHRAQTNLAAYYYYYYTSYIELNRQEWNEGASVNTIWFEVYKIGIQQLHYILPNILWQRKWLPLKIHIKNICPTCRFDIEQWVILCYMIAAYLKLMATINDV